MNSKRSKVQIIILFTTLIALIVALIITLWMTKPASLFVASAYPAPAQSPLAPPYPPPASTGTPTSFPTLSSTGLLELETQFYLPAMFYDWALGNPKKGLAWAFAGSYPNDYRPFHIRWYHDWGQLVL